MLLLDIIAVAIIFLILFIPDPTATVAQLFMGDYFHDWDVVFVGPIYGLFQHLVPNVDVNTTYGLGMTLLIKWGMQLLGGFDYTHALIVVFWLGIIYFIAWYFLLRRLLKHPLLALLAVVIGMRCQMFVSILIPIVWNDIQCSVLRFYFDALFFWGLYLYEKSRSPKFLWLMALAAALGIFHMPTMGIFLAFIMVVYWAMISTDSFLRRGKNAWAEIIGNVRPIAFIPVFVLIFYYGIVGQHLFTAAFWQNTAGYASYFAKGFFYAPMFDHLKIGKYIMVIGSLLIPLAYCATAFFYGWRYFSTSRTYRDIWIVLLAIYGLGTFTYFVGMSHKYSTVCLPIVFIGILILDEVLQRVSKAWTFRIVGTIAAITVYALWTEPMFRAYPNLLNTSRNPVVDNSVTMKTPNGKPYFQQLSVDFPEWVKVSANSLGEVDEKFKYEKDFVNHAALKSYYRQETAFKEDAALIAGLTQSDERVALLSSFEVMILSKANRAPLFYHFPLINSHPMRMRNFTGTTVVSYAQIERTVKQLEDVKPPYVFMEKVFLTEQVHPWYFEKFEDTIRLIRYIKFYYTPAYEGKYLVAMKRKPNV